MTSRRWLARGYLALVVVMAAAVGGCETEDPGDQGRVQVTDPARVTTSRVVGGPTTTVMEQFGEPTTQP